MQKIFRALARVNTISCESAIGHVSIKLIFCAPGVMLYIFKKKKSKDDVSLRVHFMYTSKEYPRSENITVLMEHSYILICQLLHSFLTIFFISKFCLL